MTPDLIRQAMQEREVRQIDVIERLGMPKTAAPIVSMVIHRRARSRRVEKAISEATGHELHELWPEWYSAAKSKAVKRRKVA